MSFSIWYEIETSYFEIKIKMSDKNANDFKKIFEMIRKIIKEIKKLKGLTNASIK